MSLTVTIKFDDKKVRAGLKKGITAGLHAGAGVLVDQMAQNAHVITGLLKNSIIYRLDNGFVKPFGSEGSGRPKSDDKITAPVTSNSFRAGSGVVYAAAQEKHNAWASKSFDQVVRGGSLVRAFAKAMKF